MPNVNRESCASARTTVAAGEISTMGDRVILNVGGHTFETSMTTMTKDPHSLLAKIAHHDLSTSRSAFIDRDDTHFRYILNFLRDGSCVLPSKEQHQQELRREAEYFQVKLSSNGASDDVIDIGSHGCVYNSTAMSMHGAFDASFSPSAGL